MGNPFSKPKIKVPPTPPVPTIDEARQKQELRDRARRRKGRAATILTGQRGDTSSPSVAVKRLLGGGG